MATMRGVRVFVIADTASIDGSRFTKYRVKADVVIHCGGLAINGDYKPALTLLGTIDAPLKIVIPGKSDKLLRKRDPATMIQWAAYMSSDPSIKLHLNPST
ncbi:hypothetical protein GE09DRAFT_1222117 [Coniochaeta sp. 2T2.1]|nr:hypothetical protein GE09DRAFT_1222117 [Coniochaeta sp. 2T2.1]